MQTIPDRPTPPLPGRTRHRRADILLENGEHMPVVLRPDGVPALMPWLWIDLDLREKDLQAGTLGAYAAVSCILEDWFALRGIDCTERLGMQKPFEDREARDLRDHLRRLTPTGSRQRRHAIAKRDRLVAAGRREVGEEPIRLLPDIVSQPVLNQRICVAASYLRWLDDTLSRIVFPDPVRRRSIVHVLVDFAERLERHRVRAREVRREGLSLDQQKLLLAAILPTTPPLPAGRSAFRQDVRHRNFALILLLASTGLRIGEALGLKLGDVLVEGDQVRIRVRRRPDDHQDPRRRRPQAKTLERTLTLPHVAAMALLDWRDVHRVDGDRFGDAQASPFLFLAAIPRNEADRRPRPLTLGGADKIFRQLRDELPPEAGHVTAHRLRHSWMDHLWSRLRAKGPQDPFVLDVINYAAGWRPGSRQAEAYAQRAVREAADDFAAIFQKDLVSLLDADHE